MDLSVFTLVLSYIYRCKKFFRYFRVIIKFDACGIQVL